MGNASFSYDSYRTHLRSTTYRNDGTRKNIQEVFTRRGMHPDLDPGNIVVRESRDSEANPSSRPLIIALDVTGSMGFIAEAIAKEKLENLMHGVLDTKPIDDPHLMFMAIGDAAYDRAPLQVSQFEADIRIAEQLQSIYLEGKGGGNSCESYDLAWYFAARHTSIDSFEKRKKKGYLFTIGDENPPEGITKEHLQKIFGKGQFKNVKTVDLLKDADEKWEIFHVIVEEGSYAKTGTNKKWVTEKWRDLLGNRALSLSNYNYIAEVITAAIQLNECVPWDEVIAHAQGDECKRALSYTFPQ